MCAVSYVISRKDQTWLHGGIVPGRDRRALEKSSGLRYGMSAMLVGRRTWGFGRAVRGVAAGGQPGGAAARRASRYLDTLAHRTLGAHSGTAYFRGSGLTGGSGGRWGSPRPARAVPRPARRLRRGNPIRAVRPVRAALFWRQRRGHFRLPVLAGYFSRIR